MCATPLYRYKCTTATVSSVQKLSLYVIRVHSRSFADVVATVPHKESTKNTHHMSFTQFVSNNTPLRTIAHIQQYYLY